ncbi:MAG: response regulator [Planctomycetota bacterium]|nr:response regulator [Planctomycetota bacterium]
MNAIEATKAKGACRFLVVDDEAPLRRLMQRTFERRGHHCDTAADGDIAMKLIRLNQYDVVVTDLRMPNRHGHSLCLEILQQRDHPRIMVVTGVVEPKLARDLKARGVNEVFLKPIAPEELAGKAEALGRAHNRDESCSEAAAACPTDKAGTETPAEDFNPSSVAACGGQTQSKTPKNGQRVVAMLLQAERRPAELAAMIESDETAVIICITRMICFRLFARIRSRCSSSVKNLVDF